MSDRVGQRLDDYRLVRLLGTGSFGNVYLAEHVHHKTLVAIKVLLPLSDADLPGFLNEARTIRLKHPHIVQVVDFGVDNKVPFIVMDYAPHGTLRQRHPKGTRVPLDTIVLYVKQIASALQYAHDERVIHRDVKPENMLVGANNEILVSDFGMATIAHSSRSESLQDMAGTVAYMAPEQLQGKPRFASDQYALGVIIYEWLCGERPFTGTAMEVVAQHMVASPPSLREKIPEISQDVELVVMTALAKDPNGRFASVQALADALELAGQAESLFSVTSPLSPGTISSLSHEATEVSPSQRQVDQAESLVTSALQVHPQSIPPAVSPIRAALSAKSVGDSPDSAGPIYSPREKGNRFFVERAIPSLAHRRSPLFSKVTLLIGLVLFILISSSIISVGFLYQTGADSHADLHATATVRSAAAVRTEVQSTASTGTSGLQATVAAQLTATAQANIILSDPLSQNVHNWLTSPADVYAFKDGAYHITDRGTSGRATVLQGRVYAEQLGYTLTMEEIAGDDTSTSNSFGMIICFRQQTRNGKTVTTFYTFEAVNVTGGEYQFWKYDDSQANSPWSELWHQPFGSEFHQGHGPQSINTVKIFANGKNFTFTVNGTLIKTIQDGSLSGGTIGMIVNYNGTEVAFKNLLLTRN